MTTQVLKDGTGAKLGEIREQGGRFVIYDRTGAKKGEFDPKTNVTKDHTGKQVGTGNQLATLLST